MNTMSPSEAELQFYYFGLYRVLRRYRFMTLLGWLIVLIGVLSVPIGWNIGRSHGLIDLALSGFTVIAGLALVQQSISSLEAYITVPFPVSEGGNGGGEQSAVLMDIARLMKEIDEGGWQDAYAAIGTLKKMEKAYDMPALD
jgi:hypothetical protein